MPKYLHWPGRAMNLTHWQSTILLGLQMVVCQGPLTDPEQTAVQIPNPWPVTVLGTFLCWDVMACWPFFTALWLILTYLSLMLTTMASWDPPDWRAPGMAQGAMGLVLGSPPNLWCPPPRSALKQIRFSRPSKREDRVMLGCGKAGWPHTWRCHHDRPQRITSAAINHHLDRHFSGCNDQVWLTCINHHDYNEHQRTHIYHKGRVQSWWQPGIQNVWTRPGCLGGTTSTHRLRLLQGRPSILTRSLTSKHYGWYVLIP